MGLSEVLVTSSSKSLVHLSLFMSFNARSLSSFILILIGTRFGTKLSITRSSENCALLGPDPILRNNRSAPKIAKMQNDFLFIKDADNSKTKPPQADEQQ